MTTPRKMIDTWMLRDYTLLSLRVYFPSRGPLTISGRPNFPNYEVDDADSAEHGGTRSKLISRQSISAAGPCFCSAPSQGQKILDSPSIIRDCRGPFGT